MRRSRLKAAESERASRELLGGTTRWPEPGLGMLKLHDIAGDTEQLHAVRSAQNCAVAFLPSEISLWRVVFEDLPLTFRRTTANLQVVGIIAALNGNLLLIEPESTSVIVRCKPAQHLEVVAHAAASRFDACQLRMHVRPTSTF